MSRSLEDPPHTHPCISPSHMQCTFSAALMIMLGFTAAIFVCCTAVLAKVGKPVEEVVRYGEAFWRQGPKTFSEEAWRRIKTRVETKEKRLNEV